MIIRLLRLRQRVTVDLHVVVERQAFQLDVRRRDHVIGEMLHHVTVNGRDGRLVARGFTGPAVHDDVGDQRFFISREEPRRHDAVVHARRAAKVMLDLAQLDAHAAQLDLEVAAAEDLEPALLAEAPHVAGAVKPPAVELDEFFRGEVGPVQVALDDPSAGEMHHAGDADGEEVERGVQDADDHVIERPPDEGPFDGAIARNGIRAAHAADLAAAVDDEDLGVEEDLLQALEDLGRDHVAAGRGVAHSRKRAEIRIAELDVRDEVLQEARSRVKHRRFRQRPGHPVEIEDVRALEDDQGPARRQRRHQLEHADAEAESRDRRHDVGLDDPIALARREDVARQVRLAGRRSFRFARGSRTCSRCTRSDPAGSRGRGSSTAGRSRGRRNRRATTRASRRRRPGP